MVPPAGPGFSLRERLIRLESLVEEGLEEQRAHSRTSRAFQDEMRGLMHGTNGGAGVMVRVDRLEQSDRRRGKHVWALFTAFVAAIATAVVERVARPSP